MRVGTDNESPSAHPFREGDCRADTEDEERARIDDESPEEYTASKELGAEIERAIAVLRPEYRTAIVLCHVEGRPYEEIARIMEVPLGTVKTFIHRARKELMRELEHLRC